MGDRRKSLLDTTRRSNFLRESFGGNGLSREHYITLLMREYEQWLVLYRKTKKLLVKSSFKDTLKKDDVTNLAKDDETFLQNRPDYIAIAENAHGYTEHILYWLKLLSSYENAYSKGIDDLQEKKVLIINSLLKEETEVCEKCNNGFCMKDIHYLIDNNSDVSMFPDVKPIEFPEDD